MRGLYFVFLSVCTFLTVTPNAIAQKGFKGIAKGNEKTASSNISLEKEVLVLVNKIRLEHKLQPLKLDERLVQAARYHCKDMAEENYFSHNSYDRKGDKVFYLCKSHERAMQFANNYKIYAENISAGQITAQQVVDGWMESPGHRENILHPRFTHIGIAYIYTPNGEYHHFWGQSFAGTK